MKKNSQNSIKHQNNLVESNKHLPKLQSNNVNSYKSTSDPLMPLREPPCNDVSNNEISSLIENVHLASSSSPDRDVCYGDSVRRKRLNDEVDVHGLRNSQFQRTEGGTETDEKLNIDPTISVGCKNEFALLDASGLPSYDTALKIQECGSILNCV